MSVQAVGGNNALWSSASGLMDAGIRMGVVAHNVANANTPGFEPDRVSSAAVPSGGVRTSLSPKEQRQALDQALEGGNRDALFSNTDLSTEMINMIQARAAYQANAKMIEANQDNWHTLINSVKG